MADEATTRLEAIQAELEAVLEDRLAELARVVRSAEGTTRRIVAAEQEIERHRADRERLSAEVADLERDLESARAKAEVARAERDRVAALAEEQRLSADALSSRVAEAEAEVEAARKAVVEREAETEELKTENASLKTKLRTLEDNIVRMRKLKEELLHSISGLTQQMSGLAGGGTE